MHKRCVGSAPILKHHHLAHVKYRKAASVHPKALGGLVMPMWSLYEKPMCGLCV